MTKPRSLSLAALALAALFSACDCGTPCDPTLDDDCPFDGGDPNKPDYCDSAEEAVADTEHCVLTPCGGPDGGMRAYINLTDAGADQDWYSVSLGTLTARSLLHVTAGYSAPSTPVDLTLTVLRENATTALAHKVDDHGQGAPKPIELIMPYTASNTKLLLLLGDKGGRTPPRYDVRNTYSISVCTQEDPDVNEPNDSPDAGATPIVLQSQGAVLRGSNTGYLATDGDVDRFQFTVPAASPGPRNLLYLHLTSAAALMPPPPYRLAYTLYDPAGTPIAEGVTLNAFLQVDLATAKLIRLPGTYTVVVQGYKSNPNDPTVVPGDLRQQYTVDVQVMEDLDMNEGNDTMAEAAGRATTLSFGTTLTRTGRLSYVPDPEWFAFDVPASSSSGTLSVKLTVGSGMGRFAPLAGPKDRQLRIMAGVPGATPTDSVNKCLTDYGLCPRGYDAVDTVKRDLVSRVCNVFADAGSGQCLWLERNEDTAFLNLRNMEGVIPVRPHTTTTRYWVQLGDDGNNWADDVDWTLRLSFNADTDEDRFPQGGLAGALPGTVNGQLTHGQGRTVEHDLSDCARDPNTCRGLRAPNDYDAVVSDVDTFTFNIPGLGPDGGDLGWGLEWEIDKVDGGTLPAELGIDLAFCGATLADGGCARRTTTAYQSGNFSPWYSSALADRVVGWSRTDMGSYVRVTAELNQCLCLQNAFTRFNMSVGLVDRAAYGTLNYRVRQTVGAYPFSFTGDGGAPVSCPGPFPDGGGPRCALP